MKRKSPRKSPLDEAIYGFHGTIRGMLAAAAGGVIGFAVAYALTRPATVEMARAAGRQVIEWVLEIQKL